MADAALLGGTTSGVSAAKIFRVRTVDFSVHFYDNSYLKRLSQALLTVNSSKVDFELRVVRYEF